MSTALVWFRRDLRLAENPALIAAIEKHDHVVPVYLHAPHEETPWEPGEASQLWLHHSLSSLTESLQLRGNTLVIRKVAGNSSSFRTLQKLLVETGATAVFWNRLYEPAVIERDKSVKKSLREDGFSAESHKAALLFEPWEVETGSGGPYRVFTPFWKSIKSRYIDAPLPAPDAVAPGKSISSDSLASLQLLPTLNWKDSIEQHWQIGEAAAIDRLVEFLGDPLKCYSTERNLPAIDGTSKLSPHLHFGEISPRQIWHATKAYEARSQAQGGNADGDKFLSEIAWREFAHHLLFHYPETTRSP